MKNSPHPFSTKWFLIYLKTFCALVFIVGIIKLFFFQTFFITSSSMEPTLLKGDKIIGCKIVYPHKGDIIIFKLSKKLKKNDSKSGTYRIFKRRNQAIYIKRVIATENDIIEIKNGEIYVNNKSINEPYIKEKPYYDYPKTKIPSGKLFVLGDNRNNSKDSHIWGCINNKDVIAKALFVFSPITRIKLIN